MKICHITSGHPPFDVRIFYKECRSLAAAGYDVTLIAPADFTEQVVEGVRIMGVSRPAGRWQRVRVWRELADIIRHLDPDLVHFHDPDLLVAALFLGHRHLIYDCHERNAVAMLNKPWLPKALRRPAYFLVSLLEPALARRATAVVLVDESQVATFRKTGRPLVMVKNMAIVGEQPVDNTGYNPKAVVHVGAHARSRGCSVMIQAFQHVVQQVPGAVLWLVGPFNYRPYETEARQLIVQLGLEDVVQLVGPVPYPEALHWISRAAIGMIAYQSVSQYRECLPTKVLEYMAAGLPVVAADVPANRKIIQPANCGLLVEPADPQQYAEAIVELLNRPDQARQLGERGRQAVLASYSWNKEEEKLLALYADIRDHKGLELRAGSVGMGYRVIGE